MDRLRELFTRRSLHRELVALDGVVAKIPRGSSFGLVGENGAGKTTLLKLVAGVTEPSAGSIEVDGTVASILELGAGFHGEFTGRENARLNAAVLGVPQERLEETLARTYEFSELEEFFDRPVRTYSTGMVMRLAFTIATEVDPDILIIDEALAVGDGHFQKKSIDRITAFRDAGRTILFCTHALYFVTTLCDQALWLRKGKVAADGAASDVVRAYEQYLLEKEGRPAGATVEAANGEKPSARIVRQGERPGEAWIEAVRVIDGHGRTTAEIEPGAGVGIEVDVGTRELERPIHLRVGIDRSDGVQLFAADTRRDGCGPYAGSDRHRLRLWIPAFPVREGELSVFVYLGDEHALHLYDHVLVPKAFRVRAGNDFDVGLLATDHRWLRRGLT